MIDINNILQTINDVLEHVQEVEESIQEETKKGTLELSNFLKDSNIRPTTKLLNSIQYQDILSQQLTATKEAITDICKTIKIYQHSTGKDTEIMQSNLEALNNKLKASLDNAKDKRDRFSGKTGKNEDSFKEIDFF